MIFQKLLPRTATKRKSFNRAVVALLVGAAPMLGVSQVQGQSSTTANFGDQGSAVSGLGGSGTTFAPASSTAYATDPSTAYAPAEGSMLQSQAADASAYQMIDPAATHQPCGCPECQAAAAGMPKPKKDKPNPCAKSHKVLFYANDFSYLDDPNYNGSCLGDAFKGIGPRGNVDIGGQLRFRYHTERGLGQQAGATRFQDTQNDFLLARLRLYADWRISDRLRLYTEGIYADVLTRNREFVPRAIDVNQGDLLNFFLDVGVTENATVRLGRQELLFGSQRVLSPLDWSNTRRTFDGVRLLQRYGDVDIDWFYTQFVPVSPRNFDNSDDGNELYGFYSSIRRLPNSTLDLYALAQNVSLGLASDRSTVTYGSRISGGKNDWLWDFEGAVQLGDFDDGREVDAGFWTAGLGRSFKDFAWKPTLWFYYDFATGDRANGETTSFNELFPLGHKYLGFIDAVQRNNIKSPNVLLKMAPTKRLSLLLWYYNFNAAEQEDNVLALGGTPAQDPTAADFGNELDFIATYQVSPRSSLLAGYSHLWAGDKIINGEDADFFYLQWQTNF